MSDITDDRNSIKSMEKLEYDEGCTTVDDFLTEITALDPMTQEECDESMRPGNSGIDITRIDKDIFKMVCSSPIEET